MEPILTLPLIPAYILSISCFLVVILLIPALRRLPEFSREELIILFAGGAIYLAVGFLLYGSLYFYYTTYVTEIEVRQRSIRFALLFLTAIVNCWLLVIIFYKKGKTE
jgi:hypothetical protein